MGAQLVRPQDANLRAERRQHVTRDFAASFVSPDPRICVQCGSTGETAAADPIEAPTGERRMPVHPVPCASK
jgi:hypothetical protein